MSFDSEIELLIQNLISTFRFVGTSSFCSLNIYTSGVVLAQWGKRAVLQPQGCGFDPRSTPLVASLSVLEQGTEPPVASRALHRSPLLLNN